MLPPPFANLLINSFTNFIHLCVSHPHLFVIRLSSFVPTLPLEDSQRKLGMCKERGLSPFLASPPSGVRGLTE